MPTAVAAARAHRQLVPWIRRRCLRAGGKRAAWTKRAGGCAAAQPRSRRSRTGFRAKRILNVVGAGDTTPAAALPRGFTRSSAGRPRGGGIGGGGACGGGSGGVGGGCRARRQPSPSGSVNRGRRVPPGVPPGGSGTPPHGHSTRCGAASARHLRFCGRAKRARTPGRRRLCGGVEPAVAARLDRVGGGCRALRLLRDSIGQLPARIGLCHGSGGGVCAPEAWTRRSGGRAAAQPCSRR